MRKGCATLFWISYNFAYKTWTFVFSGQNCVRKTEWQNFDCQCCGTFLWKKILPGKLANYLKLKTNVNEKFRPVWPRELRGPALTAWSLTSAKAIFICVIFYARDLKKYILSCFFGVLLQSKILRPFLNKRANVWLRGIQQPENALKNPGPNHRLILRKNLTENT